MHPTRTAALIALLVMPTVHAVEVPMDPELWDSQGTPPVFALHEGRQAVQLNGTVISIPGATMRDGTIEYQQMLPADWSFHAVFFRAAGVGGFEQFYVRPRQSGRDDALQYTPGYNSLVGWQLYHGEGFWGNAELPPGQWMRVKLEFQDDVLRVSLDGEVVLISRLRRDPIDGSMGLQSSFEPGWFADFSYTPGRPLDGEDIELPVYQHAPGQLTDFEASGPLVEGELDSMLDTAELEWDAVEVEDVGSINLARYFVIDRETGANTALVRTTITGDGPVPVSFGYSDRVRVYYNGREIYRGNANWRGRDFRYLGSIGLHDTVVVDAGERAANELVFAVSESFGGWGLTAAITPPDEAEGE